MVLAPMLSSERRNNLETLVYSFIHSFTIDLDETTVKDSFIHSFAIDLDETTIWMKRPLRRKDRYFYLEHYFGRKDRYFIESIIVVWRHIFYKKSVIASFMWQTIQVLRLWALDEKHVERRIHVQIHEIEPTLLHFYAWCLYCDY